MIGGSTHSTREVLGVRWGESHQGNLNIILELVKWGPKVGGEIILHGLSSDDNWYLPHKYLQETRYCKMKKSSWFGF